METTSQPVQPNSEIKVEPAVEPTDNPPEEVKSKTSEDATVDEPHEPRDTTHEESLATAKTREMEDSECNEPQAKRMKVEGVCVTCLGVLQEENWPQCWNMVKEMLDKKRSVNAMFP